MTSLQQLAELHRQIWAKASIIDAFFIFAQCEQQREAEALIKEENLNEGTAKRYISTSLK